MISIIIPTRNNSSTIEKLLQSIKEQNFKDFEVIIVDSSSDSTPIIASKYSFVKIIRCPPLGANMARNIGISKAKGEIIAFTDGDCFLPQDWLKNIYDFFKKNTNIHVVGGSVYTSKELGGNVVADYYNESLWPMMPIYRRELEINIDNFHLVRVPNSNNLAFRREIFSKKFFFDENFKGGYEETELLWRLLLNNFRIKVTPRIYVEHFHTKSFLKVLKRAFNYGRGHFLFFKKYRKSPLALYGSIIIYFYLFLYIPFILITMIYFNILSSFTLILLPYLIFLVGYFKRGGRRKAIYSIIDLWFYTFMSLGFLKENLAYVKKYLHKILMKR